MTKKEWGTKVEVVYFRHSVRTYDMIYFNDIEDMAEWFNHIVKIDGPMSVEIIEMNVRSYRDLHKW